MKNKRIMWFKRKKNMVELKLDLKKKKVEELIDLMLQSKTVELHIAPISDIFFIIDKTNEINISISDKSIKVANHNYLYEVNFSLSVMNEFMDKVRDKIEERADGIRKNLFRNEIELITKLKNVYEEDSKSV